MWKAYNNYIICHESAHNHSKMKVYESIFKVNKNTATVFVMWNQWKISILLMFLWFTLLKRKYSQWT